MFILIQTPINGSIGFVIENFHLILIEFLEGWIGKSTGKLFRCFMQFRIAICTWYSFREGALVYDSVTVDMDVTTESFT